MTFSVTNEGPKHEHEFIVAKTDRAPQALPTAEDGSVDEEGAFRSNIPLLGEIEEEVGSTQSKTMNLGPGKYVLFCNVVEDTPTADMGGVKSHYKLGMFAAFTVT